MKIAVISDTQLPLKDLSACFEISNSYLQKSDLIVHLGDGINAAKPFISKLKHKTIYIKGNHDKLSDSKICNKTLRINGLKILLTHGSREIRFTEKLNIIENRLRTLLRIPHRLDAYYSELFDKYNNKFDIVLYGHMHIPRIDTFGETIFLCSGGFSSIHSTKGIPSFAMLDFKEKKTILSIYHVILNENKVVVFKEKYLYTKGKAKRKSL